jgi:hypothetical protein
VRVAVLFRLFRVCIHLLETISPFDDALEKKRSNSEYMVMVCDKKKIMWWIILYLELTHCLSAIAFSCVVTNFMACLSYLSGTLREKGAHFLSLVTIDCNVAILMCD